MTADELFRQALDQHEALFKAKKHHPEYSLDNLCQRTQRLIWNGRRADDPKWILCVDILPGGKLPETDTALHGGEYMALHHDELGWDAVDISIVGTHPGKYLAYFTGAGGYGHICTLVITAPGVGILYDNAGKTRKWNNIWKRRLFGAYRPKPTKD